MLMRKNTTKSNTKTNGCVTMNTGKKKYFSPEKEENREKKEEEKEEKAAEPEEKIAQNRPSTKKGGKEEANHRGVKEPGVFLEIDINKMILRKN